MEEPVKSTLINAKYIAFSTWNDAFFNMHIHFHNIKNNWFNSIVFLLNIFFLFTTYFSLVHIN